MRVPSRGKTSSWTTLAKLRYEEKEMTDLETPRSGPAGMMEWWELRLWTLIHEYMHELWLPASLTYLDGLRYLEVAVDVVGLRNAFWDSPAGKSATVASPLFKQYWYMSRMIEWPGTVQETGHHGVCWQSTCTHLTYIAVPECSILVWYPAV